MKSLVFAVKDAALDSFDRPFTMPTTAIACRMFYDEISNPETQWSKHPDDYGLYVVGEFDHDTGFLDNREPMRIAWGREAPSA